jgi:hypothetical protein
VVWCCRGRLQGHLQQEVCGLPGVEARQECGSDCWVVSACNETLSTHMPGRCGSRAGLQNATHAATLQPGCEAGGARHGHLPLQWQVHAHCAHVLYEVTTSPGPWEGADDAAAAVGAKTTVLSGVGAGELKGPAARPSP